MEIDAHESPYDQPESAELPGAVVPVNYDVADNAAYRVLTVASTSSDGRTALHSPSNPHSHSVVNPQPHSELDPSLGSTHRSEAGGRGSASALLRGAPKENAPRGLSTAAAPALMAWNASMYNLVQDQSGAGAGVYETDVDAMLFDDARDGNSGNNATITRGEVPYDLAQPGTRAGTYSNSGSIGGNGWAHYGPALTSGDVYYQIPTSENVYTQVICSPATSSPAAMYELPVDSSPSPRSTDAVGKSAWSERTYRIPGSIAQLMNDPNAPSCYSESGSVRPSAGAAATSRDPRSSAASGTVRFNQDVSKKKKCILLCIMTALLLAGVTVAIVLFTGGGGSNRTSNTSTSPSEALANTGLGNVSTSAAPSTSLATTTTTVATNDTATTTVTLILTTTTAATPTTITTATITTTTTTTTTTTSTTTTGTRTATSTTTTTTTITTTTTTTATTTIISATTRTTNTTTTSTTTRTTTTTTTTTTTSTLTTTTTTTNTTTSITTRTTTTTTTTTTTSTTLTKTTTSTTTTTTAKTTTTTTTTTVVDCTVSTWSTWTSCTLTCGTGTQTQARIIIVAPANGGAGCPALLASRSCNTQGCPVDCAVSGWSGWSGCSVSCGGGTQTRSRTITTQPAYGGAGCLSLSDAQSCNTQGCLVDCAVSTWSSWTSCSLSCGTGTQTQTRTITAAAANGGVGCPALLASRSCNTQGCSVDCAVSGWSGWSGCTVSCGGGTQTRTRTITVQPAYGGANCPALAGSQSCNTQGCPVDCVVSAWSGWSGCSATCGGGTQTRSRTITVQPVNGGVDCPALADSQTCNTQSCPSWTCDSETDYYGANVLAFQTVASLTACESLCLALADCGAVTVFFNGASLNCYLKAPGWTSVITTGYTSCEIALP